MHELLAGALGDDLLDEVVELTRDLIRIDTTNPPGSETLGADVLDAYLRATACEAELVARDPDRANLIARIRGTGTGPSLALAGHTDVVYADRRGLDRRRRSAVSCAMAVCGVAARST